MPSIVSNAKTLFCRSARKPVRSRLPAGAGWIRTCSSALDRQQFRDFILVGADLPARTGHPSSCRPRHADRVVGRRSEELPLTGRDQAASRHGRAVAGTSASRNRRFESIPLQRRVLCEPETSRPSTVRSSRRPCTDRSRPVQTIGCRVRAAFGSLWLVEPTNVVPIGAGR